MLCTKDGKVKILLSAMVVMGIEKLLDSPAGLAKATNAGQPKKKYKSRKQVLKPRKLRRACDECTRSKVKCNGQAPCQLCIKRDCSCIYRPRLRRNSKKKLLLQQKKLARHHAAARIGNDLVDMVSLAGTKATGLKPRRTKVKFNPGLLKSENVGVKIEDVPLEVHHIDGQTRARPSAEFDYLAEMLVGPEKVHPNTGTFERKHVEEHDNTDCLRKEPYRELEEDAFMFNDTLFDCILPKEEKGSKQELACYQDPTRGQAGFTSFESGTTGFEQQTLYVP